MKKYKRKFKESVSSIVYHTTYPERAFEIIKSNKFILSSALGSKVDKNLQPEYKPFYLSVSRIKFGGYAMSMSKTNLCTLVLDGNKFNQRYSGGAVDYWGREFWRTGDLSAYDKQRNDENEERIFSDKAVIPNANKYIKEIHMIEIDKDYKDYLLKIHRYCEKYGILLYSYENFNNFKLMRKGELWVGEYKDVYHSRFLQIMDILNAKNLNDLEKNAREKAEEFSKNYVRYLDDYVRSVESDMHNKKNDPLYHKDFEKVNYIMRKNKLKTVEDFILYVKDKAIEKWG